MLDASGFVLVQRFVYVDLRESIKISISTCEHFNRKLTAAGIVASKLHVLNSLNGFVLKFWQTRTLSVEYLCNCFELITSIGPLSLFLRLLGQILSADSARRLLENWRAASTLRRSDESNFLEG
jgi:hypothetical protein